MKIIRYEDSFSEDVKNLLVELQEYIALIDDWKLNIMTPSYREVYFKLTMEKVKGGVMFLAVEKNKAIGMICGSLNEYAEEDKAFYACPKSCTIHELIISKTARGGGIGSRLISEIEKHFKSLGCEYCHVDVFEPNSRGINFYSKNGYITRLRSMSKKLK